MKIHHMALGLLCLLPSLAPAFENEGATLTEHHVARASNACTSDADCSFHGLCDNSGQCVCQDGYTTTTFGARACSYKQKEQLTGFLLHLFLGYYGAGEFYIERYGWAATQLALGVGATVLGAVAGFGAALGGACISGAPAACAEDCGALGVTCGAVGCMTTSVFGFMGLAAIGAGLADTGLWIWDIVEFAENKRTDKRDVKLNAW